MVLRRQKGLKSPDSVGAGRAPWKEITPSSLLGCVVLIIVGFCIFWPSLQGGWLWDDGIYILHNDLVHSADGYWRVWVTLNSLGSDHAGNYYPLSTLVEWLEWRLWGEQTLGYHLVSVALHITSALLLWRLFARLGFTLAWVGAMLFLTHPLMVESVAWISELKNTLSLPLLLMALLTWLDYVEKGDKESYRGALLWFGLSLAAKTSGLMLPVVLLAHAWWKKGSLGRVELKILAPFFAVSLVAGIVTLLPPHMAKAALIGPTAWSVGPCLASVGWTVLFLLGKCFCPVGLLPDYPGFSVLHPTALDVVPWLVLIGLGVVLGISWRRAAWTRPVLLGLGFFLLNLIPVIIFVAMNYPMMIWSLDHLVYVPIIGLIGWITAWLGALDRRISSGGRRGEWVGIAAVLLIFCWGSYAYAGVFADQDRFWTYMLNKEPQNWRVHYNYANSLEADPTRNPEAIEQFRKSIELNPDSDQPQFDLASALEKTGKPDEAREHYLQAAKLNPHEMRAYLALAEMMRKAGHFQEAENYIDQARTAVPNDSAPIAALAALRIQTGSKEEGLGLYERAVKMDPDEIAFRYNYGISLLQAGKLPQAVEQLRAAVELDGTFVPAHQNLGVALTRIGSMPDAIDQFEEVVSLSPNNPAARDNLGLALAQTGHLTEAIEQFQKALEINPSDANAQASLAKLHSLQAAAPGGNHP